MVGESKKEECREQRAWAWPDALGRDVRSGWRLLRRSPGFAAIAVVTLGVAIAANTFVFSFLDAVMLRPLPFAHADRIAEVVSTDPHGVINAHNPIWAGDYTDYRDHAGVFEELAGWDLVSENLAFPGAAAHVSAMRVTANFFSVFGVAPRQGRAFLPGEDQPGREREAVLSYALARGRRAGASMLGKQIQLDGMYYTVVGIMPPGFAHGVYDADLWIPMTLSPAELDRNRATAHPIRVVGRLRSGVSLGEAAAAVTAMATRHAPGEHGWGETVVTLQQYEQLQYSAGDALVLLFTVVGLILLIACANVAGLLLERGAARAAEMAIRQALGARRGRMIRQLLTESLLLAIAAGIVGLLLSWLALPWANATLGAQSALTFRLDGDMLGFTAAVALLTALISGLAPAWQTSDARLLPGGCATSRTHRHRLRSGLVIGEVALALAALVATAAVLQAVRQELELPVGYQPRGLLAAELNLAGPAYATPEQRASFIRRLVASAAALPGATGAAIVSPPPSGWDQPTVQARGRKPQTADDGPMLKVMSVTPDYFAVLQAPLLAGRVFTSADALGARPVAMVSRAAAHRLFPDAASPIGQYLRIARAGEPAWREVVGEVGDLSNYLEEDPGERVNVYEPLAQAPQSLVGVVVRAVGPPAALTPALRAALARVDPFLPLFSIQPLWDKLTAMEAGDRSFGVILELLDGLVLLLAAVGLYGVVAYSAARRRREVGIRMALGSSRGQATRLFLWDGLRLALIGLAIGSALAWLACHFLVHLFSGTQTQGWALIGPLALLLLAVTLTARYVPARRAARGEPMNVLKE